ncbi:unnamed protein product [Urochloa decumbens]|uniref:Uncharacterized protein n=1 Tax=Urochloa decumbens TaxID=240449 RepID=A0ABC9CNP1_9POAL
MGLKLSCVHPGNLPRQAHQPASPAPARVIAADGSLKELPASSPARVSDVLGHHKPTGCGAAPAFFVCNSDALYFNEHPPALAPGDLLRPGQIYFVLPAAMLEKPLSTGDMAALAVRASAALAAASGGKQRRRRACGGGGKKKAVRVVPVREEMEEGDSFFNEKLNQQTLGESGVPLSPAKRNEKLTARLKRALSMIQEDAE